MNKKQEDGDHTDCILRLPVTVWLSGAPAADRRYTTETVPGWFKLPWPTLGRHSLGEMYVGSVKTPRRQDVFQKKKRQTKTEAWFTITYTASGRSILFFSLL